MLKARRGSQTGWKKEQGAQQTARNKSQIATSINLIFRSKQQCFVKSDLSGQQEALSFTGRFHLAYMHRVTILPPTSCPLRKRQGIVSQKRDLFRSEPDDRNVGETRLFVNQNQRRSKFAIKSFLNLSVRSSDSGCCLIRFTMVLPFMLAMFIMVS